MGQSGSPRVKTHKNGSKLVQISDFFQNGPSKFKEMKIFIQTDSNRSTQPKQTLAKTGAALQPPLLLIN